MTESRFHERRSAHRDESVPDAPAAPAPTSAADAEPVTRPEPAGRVEPAERSEPMERVEPQRVDSQRIEAERVELEGVETEGVETMEGMDGPEEAGMDLDGLAEMEVPEPSFLELVEPHVEMALRFLGELPLSPDGERRVLPRWAKREIDLLGLLEQRTRGNLPPAEQKYLEQALDHLRTMYLRANP